MQDDASRAGDRSWADRAAATLRGLDEQRQADPAWRATTIDRFWARVIDFWILLAVGVLVFVLSVASGVMPPDEERPAEFGEPGFVVRAVELGLEAPSVRGLIAMGVAAAALAAYEAGMTTLFGGTVGKRVVKIRIVDDETREPARPGKLVLRSLLLVLAPVVGFAMWGTSLLLTWVAFAVFGWLVLPVVTGRSDGRTLYDRVARTSVAKVEAPPPT